jgi:NADPH:quinone reductase-like Zn-dependent oxidoreductase
LVESLGADRVVDYSRQDVTRSGETYDVIFDTVGESPVSGCRRSLRDDGSYLLTTFGLAKLVRLLWLSMTSNRKVFMGTLEETAEDLAFLCELVQADEIRPVIDRCYPLKEAAEAHRYVESGQKQGNVVITV